MTGEYSIQSIYTMLDSLGEDTTRQILSEFSCPLNPEIESFVRNKAIDFAKQKLSVTHFMIDTEGNIVAVFTLAHKAISVSADKLSATWRKKLSRFSEIDSDTGKYMVSAFLIAQFGKNLDPALNCELPDGRTMMQSVLSILDGVQKTVGGGVIYLECENKPALLSFYKSDANGFREFDTRLSASDNTNYIQLLRFF